MPSFVQLAGIEIPIEGDMTGLQSTLARAQTGLKNAGRKMTSIGSKMTAGITLPMAAAAAGSLKMAGDFEASMTKINTLVGISQNQLGDWTDDVLDLSETVGQSPKELAEGLFFVTSAGERGAQALDVLEKSAKAASLGLGETKTVANAVTSAMQAYKDENLSASRATNLLLETVKQGKVEASELASSLGRVLGPASSMGVSFEQVGATLATYTRLGVSAREATTGLRSVINGLMKPSQEAAQVVQNKLGKSMSELRKEVKDRGLNQVLAEMFEQLNGNVSELARIFPNVRALSGILGTIGTQGDTVRKVLKAMGGDLDNLEKGFEEWGKTTEATWKRFKSDLETTAIKLGNELAPAFKQTMDDIQPMLDGIEDAIEGFADLDKEQRQAILTMAGIAAIAGPVVTGLGLMTMAMSSLAGASAALFATPGGLLVIGTAAAIGLVSVLGDDLTSSLRSVQEETQRTKENLDDLTDSLTTATQQERARVFTQIALALSKQRKRIQEEKQKLQDELEKAPSPSGDALRQGFTKKETPAVRQQRKELDAAKKRAKQLENTLDRISNMPALEVPDVETPDTGTEGAGTGGGGEAFEGFGGRLATGTIGQDFSQASKQMKTIMPVLTQMRSQFQQLRGEADVLKLDPATVAQQRMRTLRNTIENLLSQGVSPNTVMMQQLGQKYQQTAQRVRELNREQRKQEKGAQLITSILKSERTELEELRQKMERLKEVGQGQEGFKKAMKTLRGQIEDVKNEASKMEKELLREGFRAGTNLLKGFISGADDMASRVVDAIATIAETLILGTFEGSLGISSPSKVARGWGHSIGDGIVAGLGERQRAVQTATQALVPSQPNMTVPNVATSRRGRVSGQVAPGSGARTVVEQSNNFEFSSVDAAGMEELLEKHKETIAAKAAEGAQRSQATHRQILRG